MNNCTCGNNDFWIEQTLGFIAYVEEGELIGKHKTVDIKIICNNCQKQYNEGDFNNIDL